MPPGNRFFSLHRARSCTGSAAACRGLYPKLLVDALPERPVIAHRWRSVWFFWDFTWLFRDRRGSSTPPLFFLSARDFPADAAHNAGGVLAAWGRRRRWGDRAPGAMGAGVIHGSIQRSAGAIPVGGERSPSAPVTGVTWSVSGETAVLRKRHRKLDLRSPYQVSTGHVSEGWLRRRSADPRFPALRRPATALRHHDRPR